MFAVDRELLGQAIIAVSACLGAWMVFVRPEAAELRELERVIEARRAETRVLDAAAFEEAASRAPRLLRRAGEIDARGGLVEDTSLLYGRVMALAKAHGVQVRNLRPGRARDGGGGHGVRAVAVSLRAEGDYERIAAFLRALDGLDMYLRPVSAQISPAREAGEAPTQLQLTFEALRFPLPETVRRMKESAGADA